MLRRGERDYDDGGEAECTVIRPSHPDPLTCSRKARERSGCAKSKIAVTNYFVLGSIPAEWARREQVTSGRRARTSARRVALWARS
jgi:hypothetical protein